MGGEEEEEDRGISVIVGGAGEEYVREALRTEVKLILPS